MIKKLNKAGINFAIAREEKGGAKYYFYVFDISEMPKLIKLFRHFKKRVNDIFYENNNYTGEIYGEYFSAITMDLTRKEQLEFSRSLDLFKPIDIDRFTCVYELRGRSFKQFFKDRKVVNKKKISKELKDALEELRRLQNED
jgi:hypothetical protein